MITSKMGIATKLEQASEALEQGKPAMADRLLSLLEVAAFDSRDPAALRSILPALTRARTERRTRAAAGRIDPHDRDGLRR